MKIEDIEKIELERKDILPKQNLKKVNEEKQVLNIVYLMVWTKTCGGSKIILEYTNRLSRLGHKITIISYDQKPTWFELDKKVKFINLKPEQKMEDEIPNCDLIVATSWKNIYSAMKANKAPVIYFEQGGSHIFDSKSNSAKKQKVVNQRISEVTFIYTVSNDTQKIIKQKYGKKAKVVHNAVDDKIFYSNEKQKSKRIENRSQAISPEEKKANIAIKNQEAKKANTEINITTIGPEEFEFKHIGNIIEAVKAIQKKYKNVKFTWITQTQPKVYSNIKAIVNPEQKIIGDVLRNTDIYICASDYESFGLPVLEAMTCGSAVITTNNGGIQDFVENNVSGLIIKKNDVQDIINKIEILINDEEFRKKLANNAKKQAKKFNWEKSVKSLEKYYKSISKYKVM